MPRSKHRTTRGQRIGYSGGRSTEIPDGLSPQMLADLAGARQRHGSSRRKAQPKRKIAPDLRVGSQRAHATMRWNAAKSLEMDVFVYRAWAVCQRLETEPWEPQF